MTPDDVKAEWFEMADLALAYHCKENGPDGRCDCPSDEQIRVILAAVLPLAQSEAWKQGALTADPNLDPSVADEYNPYEEDKS